MSDVNYVASVLALKMHLAVILLTAEKQHHTSNYYTCICLFIYLNESMQV